MPVVINGSSGISGNDGTASTPIVAGVDTDTGIFFPGADQIGLSEGGVERLRLGANGQIGIGGANYGTSGQVLTSTGASTAPSWQTPSTIRAVFSRLITSSQTYTTPTGVFAIMILVSGATGSRGNQGQAVRGGTGGAGYSEKYITSPAASYVITIGAGGAGPTGTAGGTTTIDTISITSSGGVTGNGGSAGGVATGGTFNANGGAGGGGNNNGGTGGGGAGGSRAGAGFAGGNAASGDVAPGGGGGTGGVGGNGSGSTADGAGGAAATTVNASAISLSPYWPSAGQPATFEAGRSGFLRTTTPQSQRVDFALAGLNNGVEGIEGAGSGAYGRTTGIYGMDMIGGHGGSNFSLGPSIGLPGLVQILEFY